MDADCITEFLGREFRTVHKSWKCGKETAQRTIDNTTQLAIRDTSNVSGDRRLRPYSNILRYPKLKFPMAFSVSR